MFFCVITFQVTRSGLDPESRMLRNWIPAYAGMTKWNASMQRDLRRTTLDAVLLAAAPERGLIDSEKIRRLL